MLTLNIHDFDEYRRIYPHLTFRDKQRIYETYYAAYALQNEFAKDIQFINKALQQFVDPFSVVELGGYTGRLAGYVINDQARRVKSWLNLELIPHTSYKHIPGYREQVLACELWRSRESCVCDLFVASHVLEHYSNIETDALLRYLCTENPSFILLISPLWEMGQTWNGYKGAHVLTYGARDIRDKLTEHYKLLDETGSRYSAWDRMNWCSFWKSKT
jgi:hypothetical protein